MEPLLTDRPFHYTNPGRRSTGHKNNSSRSNDITHNKISNIDAKGILKRIIDIGKKSLLYGVNEVIISPIIYQKTVQT